MSYYALISSLPMVLLEGDAGITVERFLSYCAPCVKDEQYKILEDLVLDLSPERFKKSSVPGRYAAWEASLRNAIVKFRSRKMDCDPADYLNAAAEELIDAERAAASAWLVTNPLEREKLLDQARWQKLEELEFGTQFSFDQLCVYKLKLLLQLKWLGRVQEQAAKNLELSAEAVVRSIESKTKQEN